MELTFIYVHIQSELKLIILNINVSLYPCMECTLVQVLLIYLESYKLIWYSTLIEINNEGLKFFFWWGHIGKHEGDS